MAGDPWRSQAVCFVETAAVPELWTPDRRPPARDLAALRGICASCPVRRQCAHDAITTDAQSGVYAGIWVPEARHSRYWSYARAQLRRIATTPAPGGRSIGGAA